MTLKVLVYSDDVNTRQQVILALGRRPHPDLPEVEYPVLSDITRAMSRDYGVLIEDQGIALRGTFLIDREGMVIWSLVMERDERRTEMVPDSLEALTASE